MLKLKMMLCVMMLLVVVIAHQSSLSVSAATTPPANNAAPRLADTAERDYFTLREAIIRQKQLEGTQKYINEQRR